MESYLKVMLSQCDSKSETLVGGTKHRQRRLSFDDSSDNTDRDKCPILVYARLKPMETPGCAITVDPDGSTLNYSKLDSARRPCTLSYSFTRVFDEHVTQNELFTCVVERSIRHFLEGHSSLLFTYGTSNSGKTYTIQGNALDPGIIPRALFMIYRSLDESLISECPICPDKSSSTTHLLPAEIKMKKNEMQHIFRNIMISQSNIAKQGTTKNENSRHSLGKSSIKDVVLKLSSEVRGVVVNCKSERAIWVSYFEIYNDAIYDLLHGDRNTLSVGTDNDRTYYVKGLHWYNVATWEDAYRLFLHGRNNLITGSTRLNQTSSRSHSLFTLRLLTKEKRQYKVSSFTICDLAGSERVARTHNEGSRLTESKWINKSLMVLNRCFEAIRHNSQKKCVKRIIPHRDSKLTQILQKELSTTGYISMVVNVNQSPELVEETTTVLRASAIVNKIKISIPKVLHINPRSRMSLLCSANDSEMYQLLPVLSELDDHSTSDSSSGNVDKLKEKLLKTASLNAQIKDGLFTNSCMSSVREQFYDTGMTTLSSDKMYRELEDRYELLEKENLQLKKQNKALEDTVTDARFEILVLNSKLNNQLQANADLELQQEELLDRLASLDECINEKDRLLERLSKYAEGLQKELVQVKQSARENSSLDIHENSSKESFPAPEPPNNCEASRWSDISSICPVVPGASTVTNIISSTKDYSSNSPKDLSEEETIAGSPNGLDCPPDLKHNKPSLSASKTTLMEDELSTQLQRTCVLRPCSRTESSESEDSDVEYVPAPRKSARKKKPLTTPAIESYPKSIAKSQRKARKETEESTQPKSSRKLFSAAPDLNSSLEFDMLGEDSRNPRTPLPISKKINKRK